VPEAEGKYSALNGVKPARMLYRLSNHRARVIGGVEKQSAGQRLATSRKGCFMGRIIKLVVILVIFGFIGLTGFAYLGDLTPPQTEVKKPVVLNAD